jgi:ABC-type glycerol-3-phosphate transport system permease component
MSGKDDTDTQGMGYLDSLSRRTAVVFLPLGAFVFVLLFPFYWMTMTTFKPDAELLSRDTNPFWVSSPTLAPTPSSACATAARSRSASRSSSPTWCRRRSCSSRSPPS